MKTKLAIILFILLFGMPVWAGVPQEDLVLGLGTSNFPGQPSWNVSFSGIGSNEYTQGIGINFADTGTNVTGFAKLNAMTVLDTFGGNTSGPGNRSAVWATLQQNGTTTYDGINVFQSTVFGYTQVLVGNPAGKLLDYNGGTFLTSLETVGVNASFAVGMEADINGITGTSFISRIGVNSVSGGLGPTTTGVQGTFDAAYAISRTSAFSAPFGFGLVYGSSGGVWPFNTSSILIGAFGTGTLNAAYGIDWTNVAFGNFSIATPGFGVTNTGGVESVGADNALLGFFSGVTSALRLEAASTSAFLTSTNAANNSFEGLTLQGKSMAFQTNGSSFTPILMDNAGHINISGATNGGTSTDYVCTDSAGQFIVQPSQCH